MKDCPFPGSKDFESCEDCKLNFGHNKCGVFSIAADVSEIAQLFKEFTALLRAKE